MKEWILAHMGDIGAVLGMMILFGFLMVFKHFPEARDNKWFDLWGYIMYGIWVVGAGVTFKTIFEWIIK